MSGNQSFGRSKMPLLGVVAGAGMIIGAAGLYIYHVIEEKKKIKNIEEHLGRLDLKLYELQQELRALRSSTLLNSNNQTTNSSSSNSRRNSESSSKEDMYTSLDTEDEFYDCFSDLEEFARLSMVENAKKKKNQTKIFKEVDILMKGTDEDILEAFNLLKNHEFEMSENPDFLWRFAKAHKMQAATYGVLGDPLTKKYFVLEGLKYASKALALDETNADAHKWFAVLNGMKVDFVSTNEKIQLGHVFYKHITKAIEKKEHDYSLHYMLGKFKYELANLSWLEKQMAASLFGKLPDATYQDALRHLFKAEDYSPTPWKANKLMIAKCLIKVKDYEWAINCLDEVKKITPKTKEDLAYDEETIGLLKKYNKYRK